MKQVGRPPQFLFSSCIVAWFFSQLARTTTSWVFCVCDNSRPYFISGTTVSSLAAKKASGTGGRGRKGAMVSHWRKDCALRRLRVSVIVVLIYYGSLFLWNALRGGVYDGPYRGSLVNQNQQLVKWEDKNLVYRSKMLTLASNPGFRTGTR